MSGRTGSGWIDVTIEGETVGFVVIPTREGGPWYCYQDLPNANSKRVGSADSKDKAFEMVRKAASGAAATARRSAASVSSGGSSS